MRSVSAPKAANDVGSDAELIARVRGGDMDAYGELFERHRDAAQRLARQLSASDADDLVSEAFAKVLGVLKDGRGPDLAFRAYLLTSVRRLHVDRIRATNKATPTDDLTPFDPGHLDPDVVLAGFEGSAAAEAFSRLPERWQLVLWHMEVEGEKAATIAPMLGMSPNAVSALAYRAREGLRQQYLQMHAADFGDDECRWARSQMGSHVRGGLSKRDAAKVDEHMETCRKCTAVYLELAQVNSSLASVLAPAVLGTAATGYLGGGTISRIGLALVGRARDAITASPGVAASMAGVAVAAVVLASVMTGDREVQAPTADNPVPVQPAAPAPRPTPARSRSRPPRRRRSRCRRLRRRRGRWPPVDPPIGRRVRRPSSRHPLQRRLRPRHHNRLPSRPRNRRHNRHPSRLRSRSRGSRSSWIRRS